LCLAQLDVKGTVSRLDRYGARGQHIAEIQLLVYPMYGKTAMCFAMIYGPAGRFQSPIVRHGAIVVVNSLTKLAQEIGVEFLHPEDTDQDIRSQPFQSSIAECGVTDIRYQKHCESIALSEYP